MTTDIVIVAAARTAVGKFGGTLAKIPASELGATVLKALLERSKLTGEQISEVILGQVLQAGTGQNPARQAVIKGGLGYGVPAMTINKVCGSGLKAVMLAAQAIRDGDAEIVIAGGQESMSMSPARAAQLARRPAHGRLEDGRHDDHRRPVGRLQPVPHGHHGRERGQEVRHLARAAGRAGLRLAAARPRPRRTPASSRTRSCRVAIPQKKGDPLLFDADEFINRKSTQEALAGLRPAFDKAGSVTAGNASGLNDGAAGVVVMSAAKADALGLKPLGRIASYANAGLDPAYMGMGPVPAARKALERAGWKPADLDLLEINEAFAAQACAVHQEMGWDTSKVNVNGGAIAIGHPIGASGARILVTLLHEMQRRDAKKGIASLCIGGGMGVALTIERP